MFVIRSKTVKDSETGEPMFLSNDWTWILIDEGNLMRCHHKAPLEYISNTHANATNSEVVTLEQAITSIRC